METKLLTVTETASLLKVSKATVYVFVRSGKLPGHKLGVRKIRISTDDIEALLKNTRTPPETNASTQSNGGVTGE